MPGRHSSVDALRCPDSSTRPRPQGTICYPLDVKVAMDRVPELLTIAFSTTCYSLRESSVCRAPCLNRSESACAAEAGSARPACSEVFDGCSCRKSCVAFQRSTWSRSISSTSIRMARPAAATSSRASRVRPSPQRQSVSSFSSSRTAWRDVSVRVLLGSRLSAARYEIRRCRGSSRHGLRPFKPFSGCRFCQPLQVPGRPGPSIGNSPIRSSPLR